MTHEEFDILLERRLSRIRNTLASKSREYATAADRLQNFKKSATLIRETPAKVCVGFFVKHLTSILDMVDAASGGRIASKEVVDEKIGDAINYLILLEAILAE